MINNITKHNTNHHLGKLQKVLDNNVPNHFSDNGHKYNQLQSCSDGHLEFLIDYKNRHPMIFCAKFEDIQVYSV